MSDNAATVPQEHPRAESFVLARRGLPLPAASRTPLRAPWLPAPLRSRAQPVTQRALLPVPEIAPAVEDDVEFIEGRALPATSETPAHEDEPWWMEAAHWEPQAHDASAATPPQPSADAVQKMPVPLRLVGAVQTTLTEPTSAPAFQTPLPSPSPSPLLASAPAPFPLRIAPVATVMGQITEPAPMRAALSDATEPRAQSTQSSDSSDLGQVSPMASATRAHAREEAARSDESTRHAPAQSAARLASPAQLHQEQDAPSISPMNSATRKESTASAVRASVMPSTAETPMEKARMGMLPSTSTPAPASARPTTTSTAQLMPRSAALATLQAQALNAAAAAPPKSVRIDEVALTVTVAAPSLSAPAQLPTAALSASSHATSPHATTAARPYRSAWSSYFARRD